MSIPVRLLTRRALLIAAGALLLPLASVHAQQGAMLEFNPPEARARASAGDVTLIDVRTPEEWRETGVAPGAARINMHHPEGSDGFVRDVLKLVKGDRNAPIAVICRSGNRSAQVQRYLSGQGFTHVYNVREGMSGSGSGPGWISRGLPVEACKNC